MYKNFWLCWELWICATFSQLSKVVNFRKILKEKFTHVLFFKAVKTIPENSLFQGPALDWFLKLEGGLKQDWNYLQSELKSKFCVPSLSTVQKFQVRQSILMQWPKERVQDFVERCILAQFAIEETGKDKVDLHHEPSFERDVLLNVLLGLRQDLQVKRV